MNMLKTLIALVATALTISTATSQTSNVERLNITNSTGQIGINLKLKSSPGGSAGPGILFDAGNGGADQRFFLRQLGNSLDLDKHSGSSTFGNKLNVMRVRWNGNVGFSQKMGIGTTDPITKFHVKNGNVLIENGENSAIHFTKHNLLMGTLPDIYMHNNVNLKPGGASNGPLYSSLNLYTANSKTSHSLRTKITSNGTSFFKGGSVGIGTENVGSYKLAVNGKIRAKEVVVETGWSDFVFEDGYTLLTLEEVEAYIDQNGHLPDVPSEAEIDEHGVSLGEMESTLLQKIEELTLYTIELNKRIKELEANK